MRPGEVLAGRYRLERALAGEDHWQATDIVLSRPVVVRLGAALPRAAAALVHPNVVTIYDSGEERGVEFTVMELARDGALADAADRGLDEADAVRLGLQLLAALRAGHAAGLAHGRVSPRSVLRAARARAQLTPFSIAGASPEDRARDVGDVANLLLSLVRQPRPALRELLLQPPPSATELAEALGDLEIIDDAVDLATAEPTPPAGVLVLSRTRPRSRAVLAVVVLTLVLGASLVAWRLVTSTGGLPLGGGSRSPAPVAVRAAHSFDPFGADRTEHESEARLAVDGNPSTSWRTDRYNSRALGGLKPGVGLVLELHQPASLDGIELEADGQGWVVEVHVAERPGPTLDAWGPAVATARGSGPTTLDLRGTRGGAVLVWITDLGEAGRGHRFVLREVRVMA